MVKEKLKGEALPSSSRAGLAHNTSSRYVTIHYPFHPLAGTRFRPERTILGPPPAYILHRLERRLTIPAWMTEEWAFRLTVVDGPHVDVESLLHLAQITHDFSSSFDSTPRILPSNSVSGEDGEHGSNAASTSDPVRGTSPKPPSRRQRESRRSRGSAGAARRAAGKRGGSDR